MALKFLNKKGWHTGSLRNIENVWKAEQKHEAEQKKLEELRKQIQEERERTEFRLLQEKAGLVPHQERLEFLYDSGLSVGKSSNSEGFKSLEQLPKSDATDAAGSSASASKEGASVPGALFEEKPQSANDAWRKLHSDPLLMIRQREQEALAKIKNNPVKMAMIRKSIEGTEHKEKAHKKEKWKKHRSSKSKHIKQSDSEDYTTERIKRKTGKEDSDKKHHKAQSDSEDDTIERRKRKTGNEDSDKKHHKAQSDSEYQSSEGEMRRRKDRDEDKNYRERSPSHLQRQRNDRDYKEGASDRNYNRSKSGRSVQKGEPDSGYESSEGEQRRKNHCEDKKYRERSPIHQQRQRNGRDFKENAGDRNYNRSKSERSVQKDQSRSGYESSEGEQRRKNHYEDKKYRERSPSHQQRQRDGRDFKEDADNRNYNTSKSERYASEGWPSNIDAPKSGGGRIPEASSNRYSASSPERGSHYKRRNMAPKLSEEERAAKLKQMQLAAELHEEQRWKRIKKAEESDAKEATQNNNTGGKNFLDTAQKSVYGAAEGGSTSIAESVRRRTYYSQGRSGGEGNAFRR